MDDRPEEPADEAPRADEHEPESESEPQAEVTAADGAVRDTDAEDEAAKHGPKTFVSGTTPSLSHVRAPTIVIRRKRKGDHGAAHGGSWKIAYADFVTA